MTPSRSHLVLFNDDRYQRLNTTPKQTLFRYDHIVGGRLVGTLSGVADERTVICGHSAPFGGIDLVRRNEAPGAIAELVAAAVAAAAAQGFHELEVRARPEYFGANETALILALFHNGARVAACEVSLGLQTAHYRSAEQYLASLGDSARNMVRQAMRAGLCFGPAEGVAEWSECFDLLVRTKQRRGVQMKISFDYLMRLRDVFPRCVTMWRLRQPGDLAAAALVYRVMPDCDYVVAWGDELAARPSRAMNLLVYELARDAIGRRVKIVDLGISSVEGVPDDGLIRFKRSVGGTPGLRLDFRLPLG